MILTEYLHDGTLIKHYSDQGYMLRQVETDTLYSDPIDVVPCGFTYEETDILIEADEDIDQFDSVLADYLSQVEI